jgi:serine/threonine-protein kinase
MTLSANPAGSAVEVDSSVADLVEELATRLRAGEPVDLEAYIQAHPAQAERLRPLLPTIGLLAALGRSAASESSSPRMSDGDPADGTLGDYRIHREVGRGGMGVVYEAEQISLGRRVALKVLPFAATMDPRQLQRFHNEARAAASLHHEHIVPVFAVGCERGVHFYAMQFIEGKSLAELIAAQEPSSRGLAPPEGGVATAICRAFPARESLAAPAPDTRTVAAASTEAAPREVAYFRRVSEWGIQAAEALEYAHALGIVHRDIKPANLMVDGQGKLWVADFGLARTVNDAGLTMSGDLLGTLRYMSPEQALARHGLVDHRTDVYSLGATLYELLTGRPAVAGQDRQEILKRIADEEPARATDWGVPPDLGTIVLKALAKEPADRYATAQELADDLGRWLAGVPIRARPVGRAGHFWRWCRRNPAVASLAAAALGLLVAVAVVATVGYVQTNVALKQAREEKRLADEKTAEAQRQRQRTKDTFGKALNGISDFALRLEGEEWAHVPQRAAIRDALLEHELTFFRGFLEANRDDPFVRMETAWAHNHVGAKFYWRLGDHAKAEKVFRAALAILQEREADFGTIPAYVEELGTTSARLGWEFYDTGRSEEAVESFRKELAYRLLHVQLDPNDRGAYVLAAQTLCICPSVQFRDPSLALKFAQKAVELEPRYSECWTALGWANYHTGDWKAAITALEKVVEVGRRDWSDFFYLAKAHWQLGHREEARSWYEKGVEWMEKNNRKSPRIRYVRAEAAALLGIKDALDPVGNEEPAPGK